MKINEVVLKENEYRCFKIEGIDGNWTVVRGADSMKCGFTLINNELENITDKFAISNIMEMEFEEIINWSTVKIDTPIYVRNVEDMDWIPRHFAKYENCKVYAWLDGQTSHSVINNTEIFEWKYARL